MKYKMIIFDADDTLYDFGKAEEVAFKESMEAVELEYEERYMNIYKRINTKIWKEFEEGLIDQDELKLKRFEMFLEEVRLNADAGLMSDSFLDALGRASILLPGAESLIKELSKKYRLVIITNGLTRVQKYRVRNHSFSKYFETVIISEEIGYKKPDPMIFSEGLKNLKPVDKSDMLMVGDSLSSDIKGGMNFGIDTCWFNIHAIKNDSGVEPTYSIDELNELLGVLKVR